MDHSHIHICFNKFCIILQISVIVSDMQHSSSAQHSQTFTVLHVFPPTAVLWLAGLFKTNLSSIMVSSLQTNSSLAWDNTGVAKKKAQMVKSKSQTSLKVLSPHRLSEWGRPASCSSWSTILWESNIDLLPQDSKHQTSYLSPKPNFQRQSVWLVFRPPRCQVHLSVQLTVLVSCLCW